MIHSFDAAEEEDIRAAAERPDTCAAAEWPDLVREAPRPASSCTGRAGETIAAAFLEMCGYRVLARNMRCGPLEIDIVAERDGRLALVEVRTRSSTSHGRPEESVRFRKRHNLRRAAAHLAATRPDLAGRPLRIDLIAIERSAFGLALRHFLAVERPSPR